jgi:hypothetical protein
MFSCLYSEPFDKDGDGYLEVRDINDFEWINADVIRLGYNYELISDLDFTFDDSQISSPLGTRESPFIGHFNGHGFRLLNMSIESLPTYTGLFGCIGNKGRVDSISLVGYPNSGSAIDNNKNIICDINLGWINGVTIRGDEESGHIRNPLVGKNEGIISHIQFVGSLRSTCIARINFGIITNSSVSGTTVLGNAQGVLVNSNRGYIKNCSVEGDINGGRVIGGISSDNFGQIENCYVSSNIKCDSQCDGIISQGIHGITNSYHLGKINTNDSEKTNIPNLNEITKQWDFVNFWEIIPGVNNGYPVLKQTDHSYGIPWDFDDNGMIDIDEFQDLLWLSESNWMMRYDMELINDIDANESHNYTSFIANDPGVDAPGFTGTGIKPLGNIYAKLTGTFEGNNKKINNLHNWSSQYHTGFIAHIDTSGVVQNLTLNNLYHDGIGVISGFVGINLGKIEHSRVTNGELFSEFRTSGGFAVENRGVIYNCSFEGKLSGSAGNGFIISNFGNIEKCYSIADIICEKTICGFASSSSGIGKIKNCFARGTYNSNAKVFGFANTLFASDVRNCYVAANIISQSSFSGEFTNRISNNITNCYYDSDLNALQDYNKAKGLSTEQMKDQNNYNDWDFQSVWGIEPNINDGYPYFLPQVPTSADLSIENKIKNLYSIFPNPTSGELYISINYNDKIGSIYSVYSLNGQNVFSGNIILNKLIGIDRLEAGSYLLSYSINDIPITNKLIIHK